MVAQAAPGSGSIVTLAPPMVTDYWISVTKQSGGTLVFDGYAPDDATRSQFSEIDNADVNFLQLGRGAPAGFRPAVDFSLEILSRLAEGRVALSGTALSVSGIAATPEDYAALRTMLDTGLPAGIQLASLDYQPPRAETYSFALVRQPDGQVAFNGMLPGPEVEERLRALAGMQSASSVTYASGAPADFEASAQQAAKFLPWLRTGVLSFDGANWSISGTPISTADKDLIETEFAVERLAQSGWTLNLAEPVAAPQTANPYTWSAERLADGSFLFTGHVPAQSLKDYLAVRAPARVTDTSQIAAGAPDGFAADVRLAVDALLLLDEGIAVFDGNAWTLNGTEAEADSNTQIASLLGARDWTVSLSRPAETPPVAALEAPMPAAPAEAVEPPAPVAEVAPTAPIPPVGSAADLALCGDQLAELSAHNAILFQSGAAIIAASATSELDAFAAALELCPGHSVFVEGHTDSDGDAQKNLALSVARAEAVVDAFIARGVAAERLYAVGYGESQPVADNATADGKRQNRRIVVSVRDGEN